MSERKQLQLLYSREALFRDIVGGSYTAHNAISDVQSIVEKCDKTSLLPKNIYITFHLH